MRLNTRLVLWYSAATLAFIGGPLVATAAAQGVAVSACNTTISGNGFLTTDLDCNGEFAGVILSGTLELRGFTIRGAQHGVRCLGNCKIVGFGRIVDNQVGIGALGNLKVDSVELSGNTDQAINQVPSDSRARLVNVNMTDNPGDGYRGGRVRFIRSLSTNNGGVGASTKGGGAFRVSGVFGNGLQGIIGEGKTRIRTTGVHDNGADGVLLTGTRPSKISRSLIFGNAENGVNATLVQIKKSSITGNARHGVVAEAARIRSTTATGNGVAAECGVTVTCADIASPAMPSIVDTTCDTSYDTNSGFPGTSWGVCALD